uniref:Uncharacterized protein n=1 Tax=Brugia timori TaxID=42155 RepID=A0A0R3RB35_9BILA
LEKIEPEVSEVVNFRKIIENLNNEFHQQKVENENLLKQKNDIELQLSEHCEWLRNANNRIAILEDELTHLKEVNERTIEILRMENEALNQKFNFFLSFKIIFSIIIVKLKFISEKFKLNYFQNFLNKLNI